MKVSKKNNYHYIDFFYLDYHVQLKEKNTDTELGKKEIGNIVLSFINGKRSLKL